MTTTEAPKSPTPPRKRWRIFHLISAVCLLGSIVFSAVAYSELRAQYIEMKSVRLDPYGLGVTKFPADSPQTPTPDMQLALFFGDSRARAWTAPTVPGWRFSNRGVVGQTSEQILGRFGAQASTLKPDVVVIQCGINDLTAIGVMPEQRQQIVSVCKQNLHNLISSARAQGSAVIVTTIFPTGAVTLDRRPFWSDKIDDAVTAVNDDLRAIHEPEVYLLDGDQILLDHGKVRGEYYQDTLHLKPQAYERLNVELQKLLLSRRGRRG